MEQCTDYHSMHSFMPALCRTKEPVAGFNLVVHFEGFVIVFTYPILILIATCKRPITRVGFSTFLYVALLFDFITSVAASTWLAELAVSEQATFFVLCAHHVLHASMRFLKTTKTKIWCFSLARPATHVCVGGQESLPGSNRRNPMAAANIGSGEPFFS